MRATAARRPAGRRAVGRPAQGDATCSSTATPGAGAVALRSRRRDHHGRRRPPRPHRPGRPHQAGQPGRRIPAARPHGRVTGGVLGDGTPLGELLHDPFSDAVTWEIAPGRTDVAPAAGPSEDTDLRSTRRLDRRRAGRGRRRDRRAGKARARDRVATVGDAARDRHHAVDGRPVRCLGRRTSPGWSDGRSRSSPPGSRSTSSPTSTARYTYGAGTEPLSRAGLRRAGGAAVRGAARRDHPQRRQAARLLRRRRLRTLPRGRSRRRRTGAAERTRTRHAVRRRPERRPRSRSPIPMSMPPACCRSAPGRRSG